jgi:NAD-dependent dihydropyrimidine dehydrogenase PreA subunit
VADQPLSNERPVPLIDPALCDGCGLCVRACPAGALALNGAVAVVARPAACDYAGLCEMICPTGAIQRPFEIVICDEPSTVE